MLPIQLTTLRLRNPSLFRLLATALAASGCKAYQLPTNAMGPTLLAGDYLLAIELIDPPAQGEIVIYQTHGAVYVKRVVGLPGDTLSMHRGELFLDGRSVSEPYVTRKAATEVVDSAFGWQRRFLVGRARIEAYHPTSMTWGPILVPSGSYFILGDNRPESADSRYTGFVSGDSIIERPFLIYCSYDRNAKAVRWNQIGTSIKRTP